MSDDGGKGGWAFVLGDQLRRQLWERRIKQVLGNEHPRL